MTDKGHIRSMCLCLLLGPHTGRAATIFGDFLLPAPSSLWKVASPIAQPPMPLAWMVVTLLCERPLAPCRPC